LTDSVAGAKVGVLNRSSNLAKENVVTATTTARTIPRTIPHTSDTNAVTGPAAIPADLVGWQALAAASLGCLLSEAELAAVEHLPVDIALDLLFPDLDDAARHEAMSTLG
jgi:hypothetical protein